MDACIIAMKTDRDYQSGLDDGFEGYDDDRMTIIRLLRRAGAAAGMTKGLALPQHQMGCSCGKCIVGWLSPRMKYRSVFAHLASIYTTHFTILSRRTILVYHTMSYFVLMCSASYLHSRYTR